MGGERSIHLHGQRIALAPSNLPRYAATAALSLLSAAALVVVARRLAGALENSLEPVALLLIGVLVAAAAVAIHLGSSLPSSAAATPRLERAVMIVTSLAVAALAIGLCLPGTSTLGLFFLCTLLVAEESWAWAWHIRRCFPSPDLRPTSPAPTSHSRVSLDPDMAVLPEDVTQQITRSQAADGTETLSGLLRLAFAQGQRTGSIHVAFCPPFTATPELEVEQLDGPEARIKTAQLLAYGARLDLKLAAAAEEPANVLLQFSARTLFSPP